MNTPPPISPPPIPAGRLSNWFGRNWKWLIPLCVLVIVLAVLGIGGLVMTLMGVWKSSDAYTGAVSRAKANPAVLAALGSPIKDRFFFTGNISEQNSSGNANLVIPLSGPKGNGTLYVDASRSDGKWSFDDLTVSVDGTKQRIDLLATNSPP